MQQLVDINSNSLAPRLGSQRNSTLLSRLVALRPHDAWPLRRLVEVPHVNMTAALPADRLVDDQPLAVLVVLASASQAKSTSGIKHGVEL